MASMLSSTSSYDEPRAKSTKLEAVKKDIEAAPPAEKTTNKGLKDYNIDNDDDDIDLSDLVIDDMKDVDHMIAKSMAGLSIKERENALLDIHGVSDEVKETPQLIEASLAEMLEEIEKIPQTEKEAYNLAISMDRAYVESKDMRIRFIRAELFHVNRAALKYVGFYETKLDLFGKDLLVKDITQDDLDSDTLRVLYMGRMQRLPYTDQAGRTVLVMFPSRTFANEPLRPKLKCVFYRSLVASEDVEVQKKGTVTVTYTLGQNTLRPSHIYGMAKLQRVIPSRSPAAHFCYDSMYYIPLMGAYQLAVSLSHRVRFRAHYGDREHCLLALQSFGIPVHAFPITKHGRVSNENNTAYLENRRRLERSKHHVENAVIVPNQNDVLLGRGPRPAQHVGNMAYRFLIEDYLDRYEETTKAKRNPIMREIVESIHSRGGRFLKEDPTTKCWMEIPDVTAVEKVGHSFRSLRSRKSKTDSSSSNAQKAKTGGNKRSRKDPE